MAGGRIGAKARFDPEKCQKEIFAPLSAVFMADWRAGSLHKLSFLKASALQVGVSILII